MSSIFCTTLLSSYKRPALLMKALDSLQSCADPAAYEIIVRLSYEDPSHEEQAKQILGLYKNVTVLLGPHEGYNRIGDYFTRMAQLAAGKWVHIFDDDMTIEGASWWDALHQAPERALVLCQSYQCGASGYGPGSCDGSGIAWWLPNGCWQQYGAVGIGFPPDTWALDLLVHRNGWPIHHLPGTLLNHQWQRPTDGDR